MLSETNKGGLANIVRVAFDEAMRDGPVEVVERVLRYSPKGLSDEMKNDPGFAKHLANEIENLKANRAEAEQYVAGLLGMM